MYNWIIDYVYSLMILMTIVLSPLLVKCINKKALKKHNMYSLIIINFITSSILIIFFLILKEYHIDFIANICLDLPYIEYKNNDIPIECYSFDYSKYLGVGWTLNAIFLIGFNFIYLIFVYGIKKVTKL